MFHGEVPVHFCAPVHDWLDIAYSSYWIRCEAPIPWPPRSPDLTQLRFFQWGDLKDLVYRDVKTTQTDSVATCALIHSTVLSTLPRNVYCTL
ncbi:uncharacterized protein TNCV_280371 [Trichonephila clavipes]|nr:uncharacterized protein TNCV_280371 [Trichonephila clavipes]